MGNFASYLWSAFCQVLVNSRKFHSLPFKKMDEFRGFPAFPLLFWHERFVSFRILHLQVDLKKKETISILSMSFDCK